VAKNNLNEFELIRDYFASQPVTRPDVVLGIGDDAALVTVPPEQELVVATDMLVAGVHFPESTDPRSIGHKALAVNLSDLAAMGATPAWFTLNLSLPQADPQWLREFCAGLYGLAGRFSVALIGGDTARGPLTVGIQILGLVPRWRALTRSGAKPGDRVYVTGYLGEAALGLRLFQGRLGLPEEYQGPVVERLNRPVPRVAAGLQLRGIASACIDISDGLVADLGHILAASNAGARIRLDYLPLSPAYDCVHAQVGWEPALAGGDDYELCFTVPPAREPLLYKVAMKLGVPFREIGVIEIEPGLRIVNEQGANFAPPTAGYDHFR
jgi:thiamine-monophosphate kinase